MNIVHVGAHQDDEAWALGTLIRYRDSGTHTIIFVCMTNGDKGLSFKPEVPPAEAAAVRDSEMRAVAAAISADYLCLSAEDEFLYDTPALRLALIEVLRRVRAELVFTHWKDDYNNDHMVTSSLVFQCTMLAAIPSVTTNSRALPRTPKLFYTDPGPGYEFGGTHYVPLDRAVTEEKMRIIGLHQSQMEAMRGVGEPFDQMVDDWAVTMGRRAGVPAAEVFRPCLASRRVPTTDLLP